MCIFFSNKRFVSTNLGSALDAYPASALVNKSRASQPHSIVRPSWKTALLLSFGLLWSVIASGQTINQAPELQWRGVVPPAPPAPWLTDQTQSIGLRLISGDAATSIGFNVRDVDSQNANVELTVQHNFAGANNVVSFGVAGDEGWVKLNSNGFTASAPISAINQIMSTLSLDIKHGGSGVRFQITISINDNGFTGACSATIPTPCNKLGTATIDVAAGPTGAQTILFGANPGPLTFRVGGTFNVDATGGFSGNPVTFSVPVTTTVCSVVGSTVTMIGIGVCTVAANQAGVEPYNPAAQVTQSINIVAPLCRLDVDGDNAYNPLIDGQLLIRHLLGISGPPLIAALPAFPLAATRKTDSEITNYLNTLNLDIDGSGGVPIAATDGMIMLRAMLGFRGAAVMTGLPIPVGASRRDWTTIGPYLSGTCLMPVAP